MASLSTSPSSSSTPQWPWSVYSSTQRSAISTRSSPTSSRRSRSATCTMPSGSQAPEPSASLVAGHAEQDHAGHAEGGQLGDLLAQRLAGVLHDAGQRLDRLRLGDALPHEQRGDQVVDRQPGLGHHPAQGRACGGAGAGGAGGSSPAQPTVGPLLPPPGRVPSRRPTTSASSGRPRSTSASGVDHDQVGVRGSPGIAR